MQEKINNEQNRENPENHIRRKKKILEHWKIIALYLIAYDVVAINLSYFLGLWLRFDLHYSAIPAEYLISFLEFAPIYTVFTVVVFCRAHLYTTCFNESLRCRTIEFVRRNFSINHF